MISETRSIQDIENKLRMKLKQSVADNSAQGMLFSGGLDTSILAALCPNMIAINISLEDFSSDLKYAKQLEKELGLKVYYKQVTVKEAIDSIPEIIKILKSFDPAIPNDITVYFGLKFAKELGIKTIMAGDGSDEIFAGYSYMQGMENLEKYIAHIAENMYFSSNRLGEYWQIEIKQPFIDKKFVDFALNQVPVELKINKTNGVTWGKWILRRSFEDTLSSNIIWQSKRPLEYGSGMTMLRNIISDKISDKEYIEKQKIYPVKFINKEHLYYYEIYREIVGAIPPPVKGEQICPSCQAGMKMGTSHCRICGGVKQ